MSSTTNPKAAKAAPKAAAAAATVTAPATPSDPWKVAAPAIAPAPARTGRTGGSTEPFAAVTANAMGYALRHPSHGKGAAPLASLTPAHVAALVAGGTYPVAGGGNVTYGPVSIGVAVFAIGHRARQARAELRGDALFHAVSVFAAGVAARVARPAASTDPDTTRVARLFHAAPLPADFGPAHALRAAAGEAAVYKRVAANG